MTIDYDKIRRRQRQHSASKRKRKHREPNNLPAPPRHRRKHMTEDELKALRSVAAESVFDSALVLVVYNCALRASEVGMLTLGHARFLTNTPPQLFCSRVKGSHDGWIDLHPQTQRALLAWIAECYPDRQARKPEDFLFPANRYRGRPLDRGMSRWAVARRLRQLCKVAELPPEISHPHSLRHGRVMHIIEAAAKKPDFHWPTLIPTLAKFLGHASAETLINNYLHATRGVQAIEADVLSSIFGDDDED